MSKTFTVSRLAEEAGVSVRTIRFYIDEGLLPPPEVHGPNTLYDEEYLDRLELIRRLKEAFLPLREIRQQMQGLSIERVRELLGKTIDEQPATPATGSGKIPGSAPVLYENKAVNSIAEPSSAAEYIKRVLNAHTTPKSTWQPPEPSRIVPPASVPQTVPGGDEARKRIPVMVPTPTPPIETTWQRIALAPDVELHVRQPLSPERVSVIQRLIEFAWRLFEPHNV